MLLLTGPIFCCSFLSNKQRAPLRYLSTGFVISISFVFTSKQSLTVNSLCKAVRIHTGDNSVPWRWTELKTVEASLSLDSQSLEVLSPLILELLRGPQWWQGDPGVMALGQTHCNVYFSTNSYVISHLPSHVMQVY